MQYQAVEQSVKNRAINRPESTYGINLTFVVNVNSHPQLTNRRLNYLFNAWVSMRQLYPGLFDQCSVKLFTLLYAQVRL